MYTFGHVEIPAIDVKSAAKFYSSLFGWVMKPTSDMDDYMMFAVGDDFIGGIQQVKEIPYNEKYINYVEVGDLTAVLSKVPTLGGRVVRERTPLPVASWGVIAIFQSPDGYCMGLWEAAKG